MTTTPPVTFVYADFVASFPEFRDLTEPMLGGYFLDSNSYIWNSAANPVLTSGLANMTRLTYLMTAHLAWLFAPRDATGAPSAQGQPAPQTVGQITNASEGSVSVAMKAITNPNAEWFTQTRYGFAFWQATKQFRQMQYVAAPTPPVSSLLYPPRYRGYWGR